MVRPSAGGSGGDDGSDGGGSDGGSDPYIPPEYRDTPSAESATEDDETEPTVPDSNLQSEDNRPTQVPGTGTDPTSPVDDTNLQQTQNRPSRVRPDDDGGSGAEFQSRDNRPTQVPGTGVDTTPTEADDLQQVQNRPTAEPPTPGPEQTGVEDGQTADGDTVPERIQSEASDLEDRVLANTPGLDDPGDVRVRVEEGEDGQRLVSELTEQGQASLDARQEAQFRQRLEDQTGIDTTGGDAEVGIGPSDIVETAATAEQAADMEGVEEGDEIMTLSESASERLGLAAAGEDVGLRAADLDVRAGDADVTDEARRRVARASIAQEEGVDPEDVIDLRQTDDGWRATVDSERTRESVRDRAAQRIEAERGVDADPSDIEVRRENGEIVPEPNEELTERLAAADLEQQLEEEEGVDLERGEDFTVSQNEEGDYVAQLEQGYGDIDERREVASREGDIFSGAVESLENLEGVTGETALALELAGDEGREVVGDVVGADDGQVDTADIIGDDVSFDVPGEGSVANVAAVEREFATAGGGEDTRFGDLNIPLPAEQQLAMDVIGEEGRAQVREELGVAEGDDVTAEDVLEFGAEGFQEEVVDPASEIAGGVARDVRTGDTQLGLSVIEAQAGEETAEEVEQRLTQQRGEAFEGVVQGVGTFTNPAFLAETGREAAEFGVAGAQATAEGEGVEFAQQAGGEGALRAAEFGEAAQENPARVGGQVLGGLAGSYGAIGAATRVGGAGFGRAVSFGVQPGEELAISAARAGAIPTSAARAVPGNYRRNIDRSGDASTPGTAAETAADTTSGDPPGLRERIPVEVAAGTDAAHGRFEMNVNPDIQGRIVSAERSASDMATRIRNEARSVRRRVEESDFVTDESGADYTPSDLADPVVEGAQAAGSAAGTVARAPARAARRGAAGVRRMEIEADAFRSSSVEGVSDLIGESRSARRDVRDAPSLASRVAARTRGRVEDTTRERTFLEDEATRGPPARDVVNPLVESAETVAGAPVSAARRGVTGWRNLEVEADAFQSSMVEGVGDLVEESRAARRDVRDSPSFASEMTARFEGRVEDPSLPRTFIEDESTRGPPTVDPLSPAIGRAQSIGNTLREFGIRVDVGKPGRTVNRRDLDINEDVGISFEADPDDAGDIWTPPPDADMAGPGARTGELPGARGFGTTEADADPGVAVQRVIERAEPEEPSAPVRSELGTRPIEFDQSRPVTGEPLLERSGSLADVRVSNLPGEDEFFDERADTFTDIRADTRPGTVFETRFEPIEDVRPEPVETTTQDIAQDSPLEVRQDMRIEPPTEPRSEPPFGEGGFDDDDDPFRPALREADEVFRSGIATAEELEEEFGF